MTDGKNLIGQSFDNQALTGSGTILDDGTYGDNLPDPTEVRGLGERRTSGGRRLPDLPSAEVDERLRPPTPAADAAQAEESKPAPKKSTPAEESKPAPTPAADATQAEESKPAPKKSTPAK